MQETQSSLWFEDNFKKLHPLLQDLHIHGGILSGPVNITLAKGLPGVFAERIAKKLGIPTTKQAHTLQVNISHCEDGLHWDRCFDNANEFKSIFKPVGTQSTGYWLENTGDFQLKLTVDIQQSAWHWRCIKNSIKGINIPMWLFPQTTAYKTIENNAYRFYVGFSLPVFGEVLSYSGLLNIAD